MTQTLALIHTSPTLTPMFTELCTEHIPGTTIFHMVDESLIKDTIRAGELRRVTMRRLLALVESAEAAGADAVLVTCSSIGPAVAVAQAIFDIPVVRVDEAMAERAVQMGSKIGVAATLRTTLEPTIALLEAKAREVGRSIEIVESLSAGAFGAVMRGDTARHDAILTKALVEDLREVDVIVLAQASMARVVKAIAPGELRAAVLSSPELALQRTAEILRSLSSSDTRHRAEGVAV